MAWQTEVPVSPARPIVPGWFAVFNILAGQQVTITNMGRVIGIVAALQATAISNAASAKGVDQANQSFTLVNALAAAGARTAPQTFNITDSANLVGIPQLSNNLTIIELATVVGATNSVNNLPITNAATTKGVDQGNQNFGMADSALVAAVEQAFQSFGITDNATWLGNPGSNQSMSASDSASIIGITLSAQQISMINANVVTETIASVLAGQPITIVDAATVAGMRSAGQTFTEVSTANLIGKPGCDQIMALTESGSVKGISAGSVNLLISNAGVVYSRLTGGQSFSMTEAAALSGSPLGPQAFSITNSATCSLYVPPDQPTLDNITSFTLTAGTLSTGSLTVANNTYVLVYVDNPYPNGSGTATTVTCGGVAMTPLTSVVHHVGVLAVFGLAVASGGSKSIAVTPLGGYYNGVVVAASYINVASIELPSTATGYGFTLSEGPIALNAKKLAVQVFGTGATLGTIQSLTSPSGGSNRLIDNSSSAYCKMSLSESLTDGDTFTINNGTGSDNIAWAGINIVLSATVLTYVGAAGNNGNTVTIPVHQAGDLILIHAYRGQSNTTPTQPGAAGNVPVWNIIDNPTGANTCANRTAWAIGTGSTTSGTWTNATTMEVIVFRGQRAGSPIGAHVINGGTAVNQALASAITPLDTSGASIFVQFYGLGNTTSTNSGFGGSAAPSGYTNRANSGVPVNSSNSAVDTKNASTSDGGVTRACASFSASMGYRGAQIEVMN